MFPAFAGLHRAFFSFIKTIAFMQKSVFHSIKCTKSILRKEITFMKKIIGVTMIAIFSAVIKSFIED